MIHLCFLLIFNCKLCSYNFAGNELMYIYKQVTLPLLSNKICNIIEEYLNAQNNNNNNKYTFIHFKINIPRIK